MGLKTKSDSTKFWVYWIISNVHVRVKLNLSALLCREGSKQALVAKAVLSDAMLPCCSAESRRAGASETGPAGSKFLNADVLKDFYIFTRTSGTIGPAIVLVSRSAQDPIMR